MPSLPEHPRHESWSQRPVFAGVLVGGDSTRMGRSKPLLQFEGATFLERIVAALHNHVERTVLLGDGPVPSTLPTITRLADVPGLAGPLAGMLAAMRWAPQACWLFVACDLPVLRSEALEWLLAQRHPDRWAVLPRLDPGRVQPLLAVYEPESLQLIERLIARGVHSPHRLADEPAVYTPTPPASLRACWTNINTPEDLRRLSDEQGGAPPH